MKLRFKFSLFVITAMAAAVPVMANAATDIESREPGFAQQDTRVDADQREKASSQVKANQTAINTRGRNETIMKPLEQGNSRTDTDGTAAIRRDILARGGMSGDAQNIKIITRDGKVTLQGVVKTMGEKGFITEIARKRFRPEKVDDQLEVIDDSQRNKGVNTVGIR